MKEPSKFYLRNDYLVNSSVNKKFEEILWMTDEEFTSWVYEMRKEVLYAWDHLGTPPRNCYDLDGIVNNFNELKKFDVNQLEILDDNGEKCLKNVNIYGNAVNQWFPNMYKTKINYSKNYDRSKSIYDYFNDDELFESCVKYSKRHFKRDSFYYFSSVVRPDSKSLIKAKNAIDWISEFETHMRHNNKYDYWLSPIDEDYEYTGYKEDIKNKKYLILTRDEMNHVGDLIPEKCKTNICSSDKQFVLRWFEYGNRIFPFAYKPFRISWSQYAVNFPPLISKYIYQKYTNEKINESRTYNVLDTSCGWGGRIIGAMSVQPKLNDSEYYGYSTKINYIGCDPNPDNYFEDGSSKYSDVADFYNRNVNSDLFSDDESNNIYEIFQCGSEELDTIDEFKKYKGNIDLVFSSPPYFSKEAYVEDEKQSFIKYPEYETWRSGFLEKTLTIAHEYMINGGYLVWNISDIILDGVSYPLEKDSIDIATKLGFVLIETKKMILSRMQGANRIEDGKTTTKNSTIIDGIHWKYEPLFIFQKKC